MARNPATLTDIQKHARSFRPEQAKAVLRQLPKRAWIKEFKLLLSMMNDTAFSVRPATKLSIGGALAYVVLPTDMVPDFIPVVGWIDDAAVMKLVTGSIGTEIERYCRYLAGQR